MVTILKIKKESFGLIAMRVWGYEKVMATISYAQLYPPTSSARYQF
jgi:hypothetical protein